jgi:hypothetical protein
VYRNLITSGTSSTAAIEYCQQFGLHPQIAIAETRGYISFVDEGIGKRDLLHGNHLEEFLDQMADKYFKEVDKTAERLFGTSDFINEDYMLKVEDSK